MISLLAVYVHKHNQLCLCELCVFLQQRKAFFFFFYYSFKELFCSTTVASIFFVENLYSIIYFFILPFCDCQIRASLIGLLTRALKMCGNIGGYSQLVEGLHFDITGYYCTCVEIFTPKKWDMLAMILEKKSLAFDLGSFGFVFF